MAETYHTEKPSNAAQWWAAFRGLRREAAGETMAGYLFVGPAVLLYLAEAER